GGDHLLALLNDVLDISRIEAGQLSIECVPLRLIELVNEAVELMRPLAAGRPVEIAVGKLDDRLIVDGDRQRVVQVLLNLLSNAVKHGPEDSEVRVTTEVTDGRARVRVIDEGPGIPAEDREKLFVPFERLEAARGVEGTGLGLALS